MRKLREARVAPGTMPVRTPDDGVAGQPGTLASAPLSDGPRPPAATPLDPLSDPDPRYRCSAERPRAGEELARELGFSLEAPAVGMTWLVPGRPASTHRRPDDGGPSGA